MSAVCVCVCVCVCDRWSSHTLPDSGEEPPHSLIIQANENVKSFSFFLSFSFFILFFFLSVFLKFLLALSHSHSFFFLSLTLTIFILSLFHFHLFLLSSSVFLFSIFHSFSLALSSSLFIPASLYSCWLDDCMPIFRWGHALLAVEVDISVSGGISKRRSALYVCVKQNILRLLCVHTCVHCVYMRGNVLSARSVLQCSTLQHTHTYTRAERDRQSLAHSKGHEYPNLTIPTHTQPAAQPYRENERNMDNGKDPSTCCKWQRSGLNRTDESRHITLSFCVPQHNSIFSRSVQTQMA